MKSKFYRFLWWGKSLFSKPEPTRSDPTSYRHEAEELHKLYCAESKEAGRNGEEEMDVLTEGYEADLSRLETEELSRLERERDGIVIERDTCQEKVDHFNEDARTAEIYRELTSERTEEAERLTIEHEQAQRMLHDARQKKMQTEKDLEASKARYGVAPKKLTWRDRVTILALVGGAVELGVSSDRIIGAGVVPWLSILVAAGICGCLAFVSDKFGRSCVEQRFQVRVAWFFSGAGLLLSLALLRGYLGGFDMYLLVTSGLIVALFIIGSLEAYSKARRMVAFRAVEADESARREEYAAAEIIEQTTHHLNTQEERFTSRARNQACEENKSDKARLTTLNVAIAGIEADIKSCREWYTNTGKSGKSAIIRSFMKGKSIHYPFFRLPSLGKAGVLLVFMLSSVGCNHVKEITSDPVWYEIYICLDKSGSMGTDYQDDKQALFLRLDKISHFREEFNGSRRITVHFLALGQNSIARDITVDLPMGAPYYSRNVPERTRELARFERQLDSVTTVFFQAPVEPNSIIHRSVARALQQLNASESTDKHFLLVSDFIEVSSVNLWEYAKNPEKIKDDRDALIDRMLKDQPLPQDMSQIHMQLFCVNQVDYHSPSCQETGKHTEDCSFSTDFLSSPCVELFEQMYLRQHAASVTLQRNF